MTVLRGSKAIKERMIYDYLSSVDKNLFSLETMKKDLGHILGGIIPAIEIEWLPVKILNEGILEKRDEPVLINIFWCDDPDDNDMCMTKFYL